MLTEQTFDADGVLLNFAEGPPGGVPFVLLHGGGNRWQEFLPLMPSLLARWHVYALDLRGHGGSGRVPSQYRPEHYVADVGAFLQQRIQEPVILYGHSLGGWIALLIAAQQTEKVKALILGDPPLCMDRFVEIESSEERIGMWRMMRGFAALGLPVPDLASELEALPGVDAATGRAWAKSLSQVDPDVAQYHAEGRITKYIEGLDLDAALGQVMCPVLLLHGDQSQGGVLSDKDVERALNLLKDGIGVRIEGAGHDLGLSDWTVAPLLRAITDFVESL